MDLNIVYEDEWMLVVNKPAGCPIHPSRLHFEDSLSNGIKYYFNSINLNNKYFSSLFAESVISVNLSVFFSN